MEALEVQLKESQAILQEKQEKLEKLNAEHKQAVEKVLYSNLTLSFLFYILF